MPELPEVETICRSLRHHVEGKVIQDVEIFLSRLVKWPSPEDFRRYWWIADSGPPASGQIYVVLPDGWLGAGHPSADDRSTVFPEQRNACQHGGQSRILL
jgi:hypothetical protein